MERSFLFLPLPPPPSAFFTAGQTHRSNTIKITIKKGENNDAHNDAYKGGGGEGGEGEVGKKGGRRQKEKEAIRLFFLFFLFLSFDSVPFDMEAPSLMRGHVTRRAEFRREACVCYAP